MRVVVTSGNPVKINCVKDAFNQVFPNSSFTFESISVPSGVSNQPMTSKETLQGALNRIENGIKKLNEDEALSNDEEELFFVGIEGGVEEDENEELEAFAWVAVKEIKTNTISKAKTSTFYLPKPIVVLIKQGKELGEADDIVFKKNNSKQETGAVGLLTKQLVTRTTYYEQALILALIPSILESQIYYLILDPFVTQESFK
ncbi:hypothetical protein ABK040_010011 [Willaertia magna]